MPTYANALTTDVVVESVYIPAGKSVQIGYYLSGTLPTGITKTSDLPLPYNPVKIDQQATDETIAIPATMNVPYMVSVTALSGNVTLKFNSASDQAITILEGEKYQRTCWARSVNDIRVSGGIAQVRVEEI